MSSPADGLLNTLVSKEVVALHTDSFRTALIRPLLKHYFLNFNTEIFHKFDLLCSTAGKYEIHSVLWEEMFLKWFPIDCTV